MEQNQLLRALTTLPERLSAFDRRVGPYCGYVSTGKGITLKTLGCNLFLFHSFIYKLIHHPELVTEEDLTEVVDFARFDHN